MELKRIWLQNDKKLKLQWQTLLIDNELTPDSQVDYTVGIFEQEKLIGTGSLYGNILKCIAIDWSYQNANLLTPILQSLREKLLESGETHSFLYTKPATSEFFENLGFSKIIATEEIVFLEQGLPDFNDYLTSLKRNKQATKNNASIVMNANPFTNGHLYLITEAAKKCDTLYIFVLSENRSLFSNQTRLNLVREGVRHLDNVVVFETKEYMVSDATFPAYFLKDQAELAVAKVQAKLDARLFKENIAPWLSIKARYVGEEPFSEVTALYNQVMKEVFLPEITLVEIPRKELFGEAISATKVRKLIQEKDYRAIQSLVPKSTYEEIIKHNK
ncbi:[citrate (pro-3S)-lyase] ligase [Enterococcus rivorum]|uniref:[Citrate [pro-3S]-lyase] ligase n=1 Tax=Enterococcus rivorum TaxID=762845 RepID=A0A1E5L071_9ENTE|nr:[citrate (pro-3S)-lyase] ligase [Enterococcus rivorum]MBP2099156.1 [citrate (pro-3S)-lyase] ligase [Enterococcus rivorum]OEH83516.1 [citrate (pro-3S)-lyase] ligase [Enterococcus rivorum]